MNIRRVWLRKVGAGDECEKIISLDHVQGFGESNLCGYIINTKTGSSIGSKQMVEHLVSSPPTRYEKALVIWWELTRNEISRYGYSLVDCGPYTKDHFTGNTALPLLHNPQLAYLSQPSTSEEYVSVQRVPLPPAPPPGPAWQPPPPIMLPPYNPQQPSATKPPQPKPAARKPKPKPVLLPVQPGRRIILED